MSFVRGISTAGWTCAKCADMLLGKKALGLKPRFFSSSMVARANAIQPVSQTVGTGGRGPGRKAPNMRDQYRAKNASGLYYTLRFVFTCLGEFDNFFYLISNSCLLLLCP